MEFAAHVGVKYQTFATWRQKRNRQHRASVEPAVSSTSTVPSLPTGVQWLEAVVESSDLEATGKTSERAKADCVLSIALPGGARVELSDVAQVKLAAELLRALESKGHAAC
jgi:hypothetical protein